MDYRAEAIARMSRRGCKSVKWTLADRTIKFAYIPATAARNWDGTAAGQGNDPKQEILEQQVWRSGESPRFTNWW